MHSAAEDRSGRLARVCTRGDALRNLRSGRELKHPALPERRVPMLNRTNMSVGAWRLHGRFAFFREVEAQNGRRRAVGVSKCRQLRETHALHTHLHLTYHDAE